MAIGDMPDFDPSMKKAAIGLAACADAANKLMILASDGDPTAPAKSTIQNLIKGGVVVSTVAVGSHGPAGSATLQNIANATGGKYYVVNNANALPKIFQREARRTPLHDLLCIWDGDVNALAELLQDRPGERGRLRNIGVDPRL